MILNFKLFENKSIKYNIGDVIYCKLSLFNGKREKLFTIGQKYKIYDISQIDKKLPHNFVYWIYNNLSIPNCFYIDRLNTYFTKDVVDSHNDIDPYGEEDWDEA